MSLSHGKCWYSEAKELCSFWDVDHFRPKGRSLGLDRTENAGYWWLAFDWKNYRCSGNICNRPNKDAAGGTRGKADFFPLRPGTHPATGPDCDYDDEHPCLLDPTDQYDVDLISFDETGLPVPEGGIGDWPAERVKVTVHLLHLDSDALVDERKQVWNRCRRLIAAAQAVMSEQEIKTSATLKARLRAVLEELRGLAAAETELAGTARACLLKSGIPWAIKLATHSE